MNTQPTELHASEWIAAYYDGELHGKQLEMVQSHLAGCAQCRAELEELGHLSALLRAAPAPAWRSSPRRFAAGLMLQLPREQPRPWPYRVLKAAWKATPIGILAVWAFVQAAALVAGISLWLFAGYLPGSAGSGLLPDALRFTGWGPAVIAAVEIAAIEIALTLVLVVLMWGWLASWWALRKT